MRLFAMFQASPTGLLGRFTLMLHVYILSLFATSGIMLCTRLTFLVALLPYASRFAFTPACFARAHQNVDTIHLTKLPTHLPSFIESVL